MSLLDILRPEPKCGHGRVRGTCTICAGYKPERIPTGTFRVNRRGQIVPKRKR